MKRDQRRKTEDRGAKGVRAYPGKGPEPIPSKSEFTRDIRSTSVVHRMSRMRPLMCPSKNQVN